MSIRKKFLACVSAMMILSGCISTPCVLEPPADVMQPPEQTDFMGEFEKFIGL